MKQTYVCQNILLQNLINKFQCIGTFNVKFTNDVFSTSGRPKNKTMLTERRPQENTQNFHQNVNIIIYTCQNLI